MQNETPTIREERNIAAGGSRAVIGASLGLFTAALTIAALTIVADIYPPLKDWLKSAFFHHWVGKGILAVGVFALFTVISICIRPTELRERRAVFHAFLAAVFSTAAIIVFFVYEAFFR